MKARFTSCHNLVMTDCKSRRTSQNCGVRMKHCDTRGGVLCSTARQFASNVAGLESDRSGSGIRAFWICRIRLIGGRPGGVIWDGTGGGEVAQLG